MNRIVLCVLLVAGAVALIANVATGFIGPEANKLDTVPEAKLPDKSDSEQAKIENTSDSFAKYPLLHIDYVKREFIKSKDKSDAAPQQNGDALIKDKLKLVFYIFDPQNPNDSTATIYEEEAGAAKKTASKSRKFAPSMSPRFGGSSGGPSPNFNPPQPARPNNNASQNSKRKKHLINAQNRKIGEYWIVAEFREDGLLIKQIKGNDSFLLPRVISIGDKGKGNP